MAEAEQGPLLCAKDAHEKDANPCPGEMTVLTSFAFARGELSFFFYAIDMELSIPTFWFVISPSRVQSR